MSLMRAAWLRPRWLFNRRAMKALLWTVLLVAAAVGANIVGIYLVGSVANWERWLAATAGYFLVWRMCLYGATAYGWVWMRAKKRQQRPGGYDQIHQASGYHRQPAHEQRRPGDCADLPVPPSAQRTTDHDGGSVGQAHVDLVDDPRELMHNVRGSKRHGTEVTDQHR